MTINAEFYKHPNLGAPVENFFNSGWRYLWVKFGSTLRNEISSLRATAFDNSGHVFGFMNSDFTGGVRSLNMRAGWISWWNSIGGDNDDIESAFLVNRGSSEWVQSAKALLFDTVKNQFAEAVKGSQARTKGDPQIYATFWPGYDSTKKFLSVHQDLTIELDWWPDYDASVTYDIYLYLDAGGHLRGYVAWVSDWVEGGIFSGDIYDELHPQLMAGASTFNDELNKQLALLESFTFRSLYYLPGGVPDMDQFGQAFGQKDDATIVLGT
jgi:hypothetical protein